MEIIDNGLQIQDGALQYAWYRLNSNQGERFHCVALRELAALPVDSAEDYNLLGKQWGAVRGLYNAGVNFVYTASGLFTPQHIGIVQYYGAAADGESLDEAAQKVKEQLSAVLAVLANFTQSRTRPPDLTWMRWYIDFVMSRSRNVMAILGYPDPRESARGIGMDGRLPDDTGDDLSSEQNELLFRGLAKLREDFVFQVTARHIGRKFLTDTLMQVAEIASNVASRRKGAMSIGFSLGIPLMAALSNAVSGGHAISNSQAHSTADGQSHGWGQAHTDSYSHTESQASTVGGSETHTIGVSHTDSQGHTDSSAHTDSRSHTDSQSHSDTWSNTTSRSHSESSMVGGSSSHTRSSAHSESASSGSSESNTTGMSSGQTTSNSQTTGTSSGSSTSAGISSSQSSGHTDGWNVGGSVSGGIPGVASASVHGGISGSDSTSSSTGSSASTSESTGAMESSSSGVANSSGAMESATLGTSTSTGSSDTVGSSDTNTSMWSSGSADTWGSAHSVGGVDTVGHADTVGSADTVGRADSIGSADSVMESHSWSKSWAQTRGQADSWGRADSASQNWGQTHAEGEAVGQALGRSGAQAFSGGLSTGLVPGVSINRSWQLEDDVADRLAEVLRQLESLVNVASQEGGFMTDALLFTASPGGAHAAEALVPQAFHGPNVPTPVLTIRPDDAGEEQRLRRNALAFFPSGSEKDRSFIPGDPFHGRLWSRYSTLLTASQVAAYTAPGLFPEGRTVTAMPPIPKGMGFYPLMPGEALLGHQFSPETADLTSAPVCLDQSRLMHCMFAGDTGFGKSVAAIRWAYETTLRWHLRTVVLDFGAGWRQLLNASGLEGHVEILQLWPNAARPMRWNPLQIGRNIDPETQWRAFADIFGSVARLGVKRQKQELLEALRKVYVRAGVLVDDPEVRGDLQWGRVQINERSLVGAREGTAISDLSQRQRQLLAVSRSRLVGLAELYREISEKLASVPPRDTMLTGVLEGILFRLNPLVQGAAAAQFAAGPDTLAIEDLGKPWGIGIVEGGMFLDDFGKAFLLGWIGWHLYTDMVARRVHEVKTGEPVLQIFFEEANKIFVKDSGGGGEDDSGGVSASQRFGDMFRDARKYHARLHVITQAPHMIPDDIISSCNNLVVGFLKNPKDKDLVLSALARSEKGFHDEPWRRFLSDLPIGMAIGRLPYTANRELQRPFLFRPLMVDFPEPSDDEIEHRLGRLNG
jgi:hypothetical protein